MWKKSRQRVCNDSSEREAESVRKERGKWWKKMKRKGSGETDSSKSSS